jgi:hypothetical protein
MFFHEKLFCWKFVKDKTKIQLEKIYMNLINKELNNKQNLNNFITWTMYVVS